MTLITFTSSMYDVMEPKDLDTLFMLRKKIFSDRLNWQVSCKNGREYDRYDNSNACYLTGKVNDTIICGCRFISMEHDNMCTGVFYQYFDSMIIGEGNYVEATRFFIDKNSLAGNGLRHYPVRLRFFAEMLKFASGAGFQGIYAVVTQQFLDILIKSDWQPVIKQKGLSEKSEAIFLIILPADDCSVSRLKNKLTRALDGLC